MEHDAHLTVAEICNRIGRQKIADALGVGLPAVSNAVADERFPAGWFAVLRDLCADIHLDCPEHLFRFKGLANAAGAA